MSDNTKIEWCDATVNVWIGCTKVGPGCDHCYAEKLARRFGVKWGAGAERRQTTNWMQTLARLHRKAVRTRTRIRVFINSMSDALDNEVPQHLRDKIWASALQFPFLDLIIVTKRIGNARSMLPLSWLQNGLPPNIWLLISVCTRAEAERDIPKLLAIPAAVHGLSVEPLLEDIGAISRWLGPYCDNGSRTAPDGNGGVTCARCSGRGGCSGLSWVIAGGESGHGARPMHPEWARSLRDQCAAAGVPYFFKQWGEWAPLSRTPDAPKAARRICIKPDGKELPKGVLCGRAYTMTKVGKRAAGRLLDGVEHNGMPA